MTDARTAVLDRIVDGETAVLLIEDDGAVAAELTVPVDRLPDDGRSEGAVFTATITEGRLDGLTYRPDETEARRESAQDRFDRLSKRLDEE